MTGTFQEDRSVLTRAARAPDYSVRYGTQPENVADVWQGVAENRPLIVMIHGGFWRPEYDRSHTGPMCAAIADAGWTVATIEYRRVPGQPDVTIEDVTAAVRNVPSLATGHDGNVVVVGHSAGGHLCLYMGATALASRLVGAVALAPAADLLRVEALNLDAGAARDFLGIPAAQREDLDPARLPDIQCPSSILHGKDDAVVPISVSQAYVAAHPGTPLVALDQCGHFALIDPDSKAWPEVMRALRNMTAQASEPLGKT